MKCPYCGEHLDLQIKPDRDYRTHSVTECGMSGATLSELQWQFLAAREEKLAWVAGYAQHYAGCEKISDSPPYGRKCSCGLEQALAAAKE
jgi:hypothetical protein